MASPISLRPLDTATWAKIEEMAMKKVAACRN